jgi:cytoskeleton protein RodZ
MPDQVDWRAMEREASPGRAVGRLLRDQREARGLALSDVEKSLRIRRPQLEAIEEGRFDQLPGAAYVPAFLRAYAAHVGLDPEKVLTAYHLSGPVPIKRPVVLPADFPIVERRAPIGRGAHRAAGRGAGYGAWHCRVSSRWSPKVPPVPDPSLASRPEAPPGRSAARRPRTAGGGDPRPVRSQEVRSAPGTLRPKCGLLAAAWRADAEPDSGATLAPPVVVAVPAPPPVS